MKKITTLLAAVLVLGLVGCNTVQGFGQDVQKAGEKLEDAAKK